MVCTSTFIRVHVGAAVLVLLLLGCPTALFGQQAKVSVRVAPLGWRSATSLFSVQVVDSPSRRGVRLPSLTLTNTRSGPEVTNVALALPAISVGPAAVSSRLGDQQLPLTFLSSPLSGASLQRPMRGLSFSTAGAAPWTFSIGQLDAGSNSGLTSGAPGVMALAVNLAPHRRLSFAPRLLVPLASGEAWQTSVGTAIRTDLIPHVSLLGDVGAAEDARSGWAPLASAGILGHWGKAEIETSMLRGAPSSPGQDEAIVGSLDREVVRARLQAFPSITLSGRASRSRPASALNASQTTLGAVNLVYDTRPYGRLAATRERQVSSTQTRETMRVEWHHAMLGGFTVRYVDARDRPRDAGGSGRASSRVEIDLPSLTSPHPGSRMRLRAALAADTGSARRAITSRLSGRLTVAERLALAGETELDVRRSAGGAGLRTARLTTDVGVLPETTVQVGYTYRAGTAFTVNQGFEARVSRTIDLSVW